MHVLYIKVLKRLKNIPLFVFAALQFEPLYAPSGSLFSHISHTNRSPGKQYTKTRTVKLVSLKKVPYYSASNLVNCCLVTDRIGTVVHLLQVIPSWILRNVNPGKGAVGAGAIAGVGTVGKGSIGFSNKGTGVTTTPVGFPSKFVIFLNHRPQKISCCFTTVSYVNIFIQFLSFFSDFAIFQKYQNF